jgi:hypothetical protein
MMRLAYGLVRLDRDPLSPIETQAPENAAGVTVQLYLSNAPQGTVWWDDISLAAHLIRQFSVKRSTAILNFGDQPIRNSDRKELAKQLHDRINERFIPVL